MTLTFSTTLQMRRNAIVYRFVWIRGHWEVFKNGKFILSADTKAEALRELEMLED